MRYSHGYLKRTLHSSVWSTPVLSARFTGVYRRIPSVIPRDFATRPSLLMKSFSASFSLFRIPSVAMDFYVTVPPPVHYLDSTQAFQVLNREEKQYIFSCAQASWIGGLIDLIQTSPEAAGVFLLMLRVFGSQDPDSMAREAKKSGFSDTEIEAALSYFACVFGNLGNYQNFGDTKFVPSICANRLTQFLSTNTYFSDQTTGIQDLWNELLPAIYSLSPRRLRLGFGPHDGLSTYYSANCSREDAEIVQKFLKTAKLEAYNTRLFKEPVEEAGKLLFTLRFACADRRIVDAEHVDDIPSNWHLQLEYGDMHELMSLLVSSCREASTHALNEDEARMWSLYADSFQSGSIDTHKAASKVWVSDKNPAVETYIGFIESYRDPLGVRGEFEGFVAVVNKMMSAKFQQLVDNAVEILAQLPWPRSYERDKFSKPDFTSLDVVMFASSGIPLGINIPNYDDVREKHGFKNVALGNVISARFKDPKVDFLSEADRALYLANIETAYEIQVGLHELLGHGSGKLFRRDNDGIFNFDRETTKDFLTGGLVEHWYEPGETWDSVFATLSSPMEECRAECVGVYLCDLYNVLRLFGVDVHGKQSDQSVHDVVYVNWLSMVRSGVMGMEFYSPAENGGDTGAWRQAHSCARYAILRVLMEADPTMVRVDQVTGADGAPDLLITLDRNKLKTVAKPAIGTFLAKLQYYKSTANVKDGKAFFMNYSELLPEHLAVRKIVIDRKRPRPLFVQPNLRQVNGEIELVPYPTTYAGLIQSYVDRFRELPRGPQAVKALEAAWRRDQPYFKDIPL
ncbi:bifunctional diacylglycerol diphosphate phosphatase/phosphatidate phosphatase [Clonorchis sinensis]|uniref:Dipeptidyl peptidase 3 n=1 Tax=Clonorchis sinensis TaxID=79923 RepID=A0A8T1MAZ3_CLOSI|nr:bifunctional diacylglycerol diphosphate phosphatase/phosphatidate phosphatase [Clonorchis sinensis]